MTHRVVLTWKTRKDEVIVEECDLISEEDPLFTTDGHPLNEGIMNELAQNGYVLFEDDQGIFGLDPSQIVNVEKLGNDEF